MTYGHKTLLTRPIQAPELDVPLGLDELRPGSMAQVPRVPGVMLLNRRRDPHGCEEPAAQEPLSLPTPTGEPSEKPEESSKGNPMVMT